MLAGNLNRASMSVKASFFSRRSRNIGYDQEDPPLSSTVERPGMGPGDFTRTSSSGRATGSFRNMIWSINEKIAEFAPIPSAREMTATAVNPGLLRNKRNAY